jgi:hypothetical protein
MRLVPFKTCCPIMFFNPRQSGVGWECFASGGLCLFGGICGYKNTTFPLMTNPVTLKCSYRPIIVNKYFIGVSETLFLLWWDSCLWIEWPVGRKVQNIANRCDGDGWRLGVCSPLHCNIPRLAVLCGRDTLGLGATHTVCRVTHVGQKSRSRTWVWVSFRTAFP